MRTSLKKPKEYDVLISSGRLFHRIAPLYNFNTCCICEKMTSLTRILNQADFDGTRKINGGRKLSEIKVQKPRVLMFAIDWNLARYLGKIYCLRKCKKVDIENFVMVALLRLVTTHHCSDCNKWRTTYDRCVLSKLCAITVFSICDSPITIYEYFVIISPLVVRCATALLRIVSTEREPVTD